VILRISPELVATDHAEFLSIYRLIGLPIQEATENGQEYDLQVQRHAPVSHVVKVVLDSIRDGRVAATQTIDLSPPRNTTLHVMTAHIPRNFVAKFLDEKREFGAWTNYAHITV